MIAYANTTETTVQEKDLIVLEAGAILFSQKEEALKASSNFFNDEEETKTLAVALRCTVFDSLNNVHINILVKSGYKVLYSQVKDTNKSGLLDKKGLKEKLIELGFGAFMVFDNNIMYFKVLEETEVRVLKIEQQEEGFGKFYLN